MNNNQQLYSPAKKLSNKQMAMLLASIVAVMPFAIDVYLPAIPQIAHSLHADVHRIEQTLSSFIFGVAIGQLLGGSLSDIKGRRNIALVGLAIFIVGSLGLVFIQTVQQMLCLRVVQAIGAGMATVVVGAVVRDNYDGIESAQMFVLIGVITLMAPLIAPMLGERLLILNDNWRSIFVFLLAYGVLVFVLLLVFLPQHKRAEPITRDVFQQIMARYKTVWQTRPALGFMFLQATSFGSMLAFLTESPFVYIKLYGLIEQQYAWVFACNIVTMVTFNRITAWRLKKGTAPEKILCCGIVLQLLANFSLCLMVGLMGLPFMPLLVLGIMISVGTQGLIFANTQALFMNYFKEIGGSANAMLATVQSLVGALVGFLATLLHNGSALVMVGMMFCSSCCGVAFLWYFSRQIVLRRIK